MSSSAAAWSVDSMRLDRTPSGSPTLSAACASTRVSARLLLMRERAAAQDHRVAGLDAQPGGIGGHVGARLVDHRDHAERNADLRQLDAVGQRVALDDLADRIGQQRERLERLGHRLEPSGSQLEPVEQARAGCPCARAAAMSASLAARISSCLATSACDITSSARLRCSVEVIASASGLARLCASRDSDMTAPSAPRDMTLTLPLPHQCPPTAPRRTPLQDRPSWSR